MTNRALALYFIQQMYLHVSCVQILKQSFLYSNEYTELMRDM